MPATDSGVSGLGSVLQSLREGAAHGTGQATLLHGAVAVFHVDFKAQRVSCLGAGPPEERRLGQHLAAMAREVRLSESVDPNVNERVRDRRSQALSSLLWDAALDAGPEHRIAEIDADTVVRLRRWPGFHLLAHRHDHFRLCSLMLRRPSSARECVDMLGIDMEQTQAFAHAAYVAGCAELRPAEASSAHAAKVGWRHGGSRLADWWRSVREAQRAAS